jgi:cyclic pyranopterin phosphate synthase
MERATLDAIVANAVAKGDVLGVARLAGIMAAKRTSDLIPLCHPLALTDVAVSLTPDCEPAWRAVEAVAKTTGKTGVEMEALTAVSVALLDRLRHGEGDGPVDDDRRYIVGPENGWGGRRIRKT